MQQNDLLSNRLMQSSINVCLCLCPSSLTIGHAAELNAFHVTRIWYCAWHRFSAAGQKSDIWGFSQNFLHVQAQTPSISTRRDMTSACCSAACSLSTMYGTACHHLTLPFSPRPTRQARSLQSRLCRQQVSIVQWLSA